MKFKKNRIVFISIFIVFLSGMLIFYFWYKSKCVHFQDKNMAVQALYLVDSRRGKVLKKEAEQITSIYTTDPDGRFTTLEDLKQFPNLTRLSLTYDTEAMTDEEKAELKQLHPKNIQMLSETLPDLPKLKELDLTYFDYFENVDFLSECDQIETLEIRYNKIQNIDGIKEMKNLHVLDLRANPFTDLSPLTELDNLEILILDMVPAENPEVLKSLPSLKMLVLSPQNPEQEIILNELKNQDVAVYNEYNQDAYDKKLELLGREKMGNEI